MAAEPDGASVPRPVSARARRGKERSSQCGDSCPPLYRTREVRGAGREVREVMSVAAGVVGSDGSAGGQEATWIFRIGSRRRRNGRQDASTSKASELE